MKEMIECLPSRDGDAAFQPIEVEKRGSMLRGGRRTERVEREGVVWWEEERKGEGERGVGWEEDRKGRERGRSVVGGGKKDSM
jgi:hypothetical protein